METASFTVAGIFGDCMVLQRNKPVRIWGKSEKDQLIRICIADVEAGSANAAKGVWRITLPPMEAR